MAQVRFFGMRLNFQDLKTMMADKHFTGLIFQPIMEDSEKWKDEFTLICYAMYDNVPPPPPRVPLEMLKNIIFRAKYRLELGNLPFTRAKIQNFIDDTPDAPYLYLLPKQFDDYVAYKVTTDPSRVALLEDELKPSPPAD